MPDIFESSSNCLTRAKEHLTELKLRMKAFLKAKDWTTPAPELDPDGINYLWKIKFTKPFPTILANVAADAVNNLRAALDQIWVTIARASHAIGPTEQAYFPIANSAAKLENNINSGCKKFHQDILSLLRGFQPYKGGNDLIWTLNRVSTTNKHDITVPIIIIPGFRMNNIQATSIDGPVRATVPQLEWDRGKNEIIYLIVPAKPTPLVHCDVVVTINIAFDKIIGGDTTFAVLKNMASIVERILMGLEAETRRLGFIT
jgi:hypothetical protein